MSGKIRKKCESCSKTYEVYPYRTDSRFCSNRCRGKWLRLSGIKPPPRTGTRPWNKGMKRLSHCGFQKGINNPSWKGGTTTKIRDRFRKEWTEWREKVFRRDGYTCQECDIIGGRLDPHHKIPVSVDPSMAFETNNGVTLCHECHKKTDTYGNFKGI